METKTINRGDWTGREITYKFGPRTVRIDEQYVYRIVKVPGCKDFWTVYDYENQEFCKIHKYKDWFYSHGAGVEREAKNMDEVIVQLHCNLV